MQTIVAGNIPDVDTGSPESGILDSDGLDAVLTASTSGSGETATTNAED